MIKKLLPLCFLLATFTLSSQVIPKKKIVADVPFATVEKTPTYPGCDGTTNGERKKCTNEKTVSFLHTHFNTSILKRTDHKIGVHFRIDSTGRISQIASGTRHKHLEAELIRVASKLPQFIPGEQRGKKVGVLYGAILKFPRTRKTFRKNKS